MEEPRRPDPDALLAAHAKAGKGRLKVFLGMSPGVGKTYEMLNEARRRQAEGLDVLVGVVETHGRKETEALCEGLEILPRRPDLKLIVTSATIDADRFARHFGREDKPAPVIEVSGRLYPVEVRYRPVAEDSPAVKAAQGTTGREKGEKGERGKSARDRDLMESKR